MKNVILINLLIIFSFSIKCFELINIKFVFFSNFFKEILLKPGDTIISKKLFKIKSAKLASMFLFNSTTPPNALFLSDLIAFFNAIFILFDDAAPQALLCFIITAVGSLNSLKKSRPLFISKILL